jgi:hypothetical protein
LQYNKQDIYEKITGEQKLIIILCKIKLDRDDLKFLQSNPIGSFDWNYILSFSQKHGISSLIYSNILRYLDSKVPAIILNSFRANNLENSKKNLFLTSVLIKIVNELNESGTEVIPYKGAVLSQLIYQNVTIREFSDLDLIVFKKDIPRVKEYLVKNNFNTQFDLVKYQQDYYLNSKYYYINFLRSDNKVALDLHWASAAPNYSFSRPLDYFYGRLEELEINNKVFAVLSTEDLFLQLCLHGAKHNWSRFNWITDIANLLVIKPEIDYDYMIYEAKKLNCINVLAYGLGLINKLFNLRIILDKDLGLKNENKISGQQLSLITTIFELDNYNNKTEVSLFPEYFNSYKDKVNFYMNNYIYPTPIELSLINLGGRLFFLYYLIRAMRIVCRGMMRILKVQHS